ncbi:MAG: hypothetical protein E7Y34_01815 [Mycoplasma sp.]|nr:hypothetical protein [Mycoplasma sp.]
MSPASVTKAIGPADGLSLLELLQEQATKRELAKSKLPIPPQLIRFYFFSYFVYSSFIGFFIKKLYLKIDNLSMLEIFPVIE